MSIKYVFPILLSVCSLVACGRSPAPAPETKSAMAPSAMRVAPPLGPAPLRPASSSGGTCVDPVLIQAFAELTSCNFKAGVIDYQCAAWKKVHQLISLRERENKALVQLSLVGLLGDSDERVRLTAAKCLSSYALQRSVSQRLIAAYKREKNAYVRSWIIHSLHSPRPEAIGLVLSALNTDTDAVVRARAAHRLSIGQFARNPAVAKALLKALRSDKSVEVRKRAAESLGSIRKDKATEKQLIQCLRDPQIGPHCAIGLSRMRSAAGYDAVLVILREGLKKRAVRPLYVWTIMNFVRLPFFRATPVRVLLQRIAGSVKMTPGARHYAVKSLSQLGASVANQKAAVVQFLKGLSGDKVLRVSVNPALSKLQRPAPRRPMAPGR